MVYVVTSTYRIDLRTLYGGELHGGWRLYRADRFIIPGILFNVYLGNTLAMTHGLVGLRMRALASAILFFILNLIGLGLGPWVIGLLSDQLAPTLGQESLRHAMLYLLPAMMTWSVIHFYLASRTLKEDLANAPD
ncbi:MAG: hypothetical protein CM15mP120_11380 [Pseudomonadota bacterium]|nr:MAG: hypothetical protein CM15mP120_11380 [Pseudomonadota bacterium]